LVRTRAALLASVSILSFAVPALAPDGSAQGLPRPGSSNGNIVMAAAQPQASPASPIASIRVDGNKRIEAGTIQSYMVVQPGDLFDASQLDRSLKALYATGLFSDVSLRREGNVLVVRVTENPVVNRVVFEGNKYITDEKLRPEVQMRPRSVFTPALAELDRQKILDAYAKKGRFGTRVDPKIIKLSENRVDVVFEISDGAATYISRIAFVGNKAFSEGRLKEIVSSREEAFWRFLSTSDSYDPERIKFDKELLRRFYLRNGYADINVTNANVELAPDRSAFFVTFKVDEGERYKIGTVEVKSNLRNLDGAELLDLTDQKTGDWYDGDTVEHTVSTLNDAVQNRGYAFVDVKPQISRDPATHTINLIYQVGEGPRVYIERIDITGNVRTHDNVIRREFRLAEGDAFNAALVRRSKQRLEDLGYFSTVGINSQPGSAPDKAILGAVVEEKATGELTVGGGYSTDAGALLNAGLHERNLIGTGIDAGLNGTLAQERSSVDFSVTNPHLFDRNLVGAFDLFAVQNNNQQIAQYSERRIGFSTSLGYEFSEHLRQNWTYSLVNRSIYNVQTTASLYVQDEAGTSLLSQIGQTITLDYRDSALNPKSGFLVRVGTDFAGVGGDVHYVRTKLDTNYFIPLEQMLGDPEYGIVLSAGTGYLFNLGSQELIIDRFFLGGDNLRGFQTGGAGPHAIDGGDSLGGRFIWTQSTEFHYPLPVPADLGITGRAFVDVGALSQASSTLRNGTPFAITDSSAPRLGAGVGISWRTPFGLINLDIAPLVIKQHYDQGQFFRFGFGTRF
jgi:outer membrane protein insertion porin family